MNAVKYPVSIKTKTSPVDGKNYACVVDATDKVICALPFNADIIAMQNIVNAANERMKY